MTWKSCLAFTALLVLAAADANAQSWPSRRIDMIIPFAAGGSSDVIGRSVASALSDLLGQQVVVNNRDGASGTLGFSTLASAPADGYTIGFGPTTPIANAPYLVKGVRYQVDSFDYICQVFENPFTITVGPDSRFKSASELIAAARESPGKVSYGHSGTGTIPHLSVENYANALKLKLHGVPFRGESPMLPILIKGDVEFGTVAVVTLRGQKLRPLVYFGNRRHPALPDVPTERETRRVYLGTARSPGPVRAQGPAGGNPRSIGARLRNRDHARSRAANDRERRSQHYLPDRRAISGADRSRLQVQGRAHPSSRARRPIRASTPRHHRRRIKPFQTTGRGKRRHSGDA
jgi:tripartite-type tricarboxylate transporter receptor subunit TctC